MNSFARTPTIGIQVSPRDALRGLIRVLPTTVAIGQVYVSRVKNSDKKGRNFAFCIVTGIVSAVLQ